MKKCYILLLVMLFNMSACTPVLAKKVQVINKQYYFQLNQSAINKGYLGLINYKSISPNVSIKHSKVPYLSVSQFLYFVYIGKYNMSSGLNHIFLYKNKLENNFRVQQILKNVVIYEFLLPHGDPRFQFKIAIKREEGDLYLEGAQLNNLNNDYFVYIGNLSYTTVINSENSVPVFKRIKLQKPNVKKYITIDEKPHYKIGDCTKYIRNILIDGKMRKIAGKACLGSDGNWHTE